MKRAVVLAAQTIATAERDADIVRIVRGAMQARILPRPEP